MQTQLLTTISLVFLVVIQLASDAESYSSPNKNQNRGHSRQRRTITRFHDILILEPKNSTRSQPKVRRDSDTVVHHRKTKVLPADERLHQKYFSEKVEENLGHVKINYRLRRNYPTLVSTNMQDKQSPLSSGPSQLSIGPSGSSYTGNSQLSNQPPAFVPYQPYSASTTLDKQRIKDLEQVFRILAQRDSPLLEQMLSLRDAIERFYGIFEFMGVAKMPQPQRDAAIRKILERSMNLDEENAVKRVKL